MSTDDISEIWSKDAKIDEANLVGESKRIPELHNRRIQLRIFDCRDILHCSFPSASDSERDAPTNQGLHDTRGLSESELFQSSSQFHAKVKMLCYFLL